MQEAIVVGSGPAGLYASYLLKKKGFNVKIFEKDLQAGGCHRVRRLQKGQFSEHGPRVYLSNFNLFKAWLNELDINFNDHFTPYKFTLINTVMKETMSQLSLYDISQLSYSYLQFYINPNKFKNISVKKAFGHLKSYHFIDKLCRLSDGAGGDKFSLFNFFQLFNQNCFYKIYQPNNPTDQGWLKAVLLKLHRLGISIYYNQKALSYYQRNDGLIELKTNKGIYLSHILVLAVPNVNLEEITDKWNNIDMKLFNKLNNYNIYISIVIHWNQKIKLPHLWGSGIGQWNIMWITLSDYFQNENGTLISTAISILDTPGILGKTANQCSHDELKKELLLQLKPLLGTHTPDNIIISPGNYKTNNQWKTHDNAYMFTAQGSHMKIPFGYKGLYSLGTHNGTSNIPYTSIESTLQNVNNWAKQTLQISLNYKSIVTLNYFINLFIISMIVIIIIILPKYLN